LKEEKNGKKLMPNGSGDETNSKIAFQSVDPAPPMSAQSAQTTQSIPQLQSILTDAKCDLFERYRAMFALRNINSEESALALAEALKCQDSVLFRHEIAYVLGQMQMPVTVRQLAICLEDKEENEMVRHECAEALGSIATEEANQVLKRFEKDGQRVVRESVEIALDISDYTTSENFQYANVLNKI
jgi:deoxyhypusine monooxygenase